MLRCRPRPKETIVTMTATPTRTPIVVSVARSLACRRLRRAKLRMSIKLISKCQAGTAGVLACFVTTHVTNEHLAGDGWDRRRPRLLRHHSPYYQAFSRQRL